MTNLIRDKLRTDAGIARLITIDVSFSAKNAPNIPKARFLPDGAVRLAFDDPVKVVLLSERETEDLITLLQYNLEIMRGNINEDS